jgi:hypothetical protein
MRATRKYIVGLALGTLITPAALAQDDSTSWRSPQLGQATLRTDYSFTTHFNEPVARQRTKMHMSQHDFRLSFPLSQSELYEWTFHANLKALDISSGARLPDSCSPFPGELWDVRFGTTYRRRLANGWTGGGNLTIGSPSDRPFASGDEILVAASGFLRVPAGEKDAWLFLLNYSNNREFLPNVPILGVAYHYRPDERLNVLAGVPMTVIGWEPLERLTVDASYFVPREVRAQVSYALLDSLRLQAGFDWTNQRFFRHDRQDDDHRLSYYEKRVALSARWDIRKNVWLDLAGGWAFDRFWFEGEGYGDRGDDRLDLSDGPFVRLQLGLRM